MWSFMRIAVAFIVAFTITASVAAEEACDRETATAQADSGSAPGIGEMMDLSYRPADRPQAVPLLDQFEKPGRQVIIRWI